MKKWKMYQNTQQKIFNMKIIIFLLTNFLASIIFSQNYNIADSNIIQFENSYFKRIETDSIYLENRAFYSANARKIKQLLSQNELNSFGMYIMDTDNNSNFILVNKWNVNGRVLFEMAFYVENNIVSISQVDSTLTLDPEGLTISFYNNSKYLILRELIISNKKESKMLIFSLGEDLQGMKFYNDMQILNNKSTSTVKSRISRKLKKQILSHVFSQFIRIKIKNELKKGVPKVIEGINFNALK